MRFKDELSKGFARQNMTNSFQEYVATEYKKYKLWFYEGRKDEAEKEKQNV